MNDNVKIRFVSCGLIGGFGPQGPLKSPKFDSISTHEVHVSKVFEVSNSIYTFLKTRNLPKYLRETHGQTKMVFLTCQLPHRAHG